MIPALTGPDGVDLPAALRAQAQQKARMNHAFGMGGRGRAYNGASVTDPDLASWSTHNPAPQSAIASDRAVLSARIHDLARNDGWASGGVARIVDAVIGSNWRLSSKPNARALGIADEAAAEVADVIEGKWRDFADNIDCACDAGARMNFGGILALAFRHRIWDGEALAALKWIPRSYAYSTAIQVIHPDRLSNPDNLPESYYLRSGVEIDANAAPIAYHIRGAHPGEAHYADMLGWRWERVPRRTAWGRPQIVHAFEAQSAGQFRGVSPLAPVLKKLRMLGRYDEAELQAALLNAVMAAFVTSPHDPEQLADSLDTGALSKYQDVRLDWHEERPISLGGAQLNFLAPGEEIKLTNPNHPNSVFDSFERTVLRNIATAIGVSYEQLSMDWSQVNYSSARAALVEIWRGFTARKDNFAFQFVQPIYSAWLEEAIDRGDVKLPKGAPSFYEAKTAWCASKWVGPARGWVDPMKEAQAAVARIEAGLSTLEDECAEQGRDYQDVIVQQGRENKMRERAGLPPIHGLSGQLAPNTQIVEEREEPAPDKSEKGRP